MIETRRVTRAIQYRKTNLIISRLYKTKKFIKDTEWKSSPG